MPKLTKRFVDSVRPDPDRDVFHWDSELRGFGLRLKPSGRGAFIIQYRNAHGRTRRMVVGKLGTLTPDEARGLARRKLGAVADGADPSAERQQARKAMTVGELCDLYVREAEAGRILGRRRRPIKASTLDMDRSRIERHVKPLIGRRAVAGLTLADIERLQADIAAGKTAKPRREKGRGGVTTGGQGVAARTVGMFGTILEFAKRRRIIEANPARGVQRHGDGRQQRFLALDEIEALGQAMRATGAEGENPTGLAAIRALLLSGCRRMEILRLRDSELDAGARCIRFADTKGGAQLRPLGRHALDLLTSLRRRDGNPYLFPADRGDGHFVGLPRVLERVCARAGLEGVTVHVLRHSYGAAAAELGFSELTIAGLLGHRVGGVTARYAHVPDSALLAAADRVSSHIAAALDGTATNAEVVPVPDARQAG